MISPLLANVFLHYVFDLWIEWWRKHRCRGDVVVIPGTAAQRWSADDFVIGFENHSEATACLEELRTRFAKFGLKRHEGKTRLIEFGRYAAERRSGRDEGRPETFHFLGFTHQCAQTRKHGRFTIHRHSMAKRIRITLFVDEVTRLWLGQLRRRSQRGRNGWTWERMQRLARQYLPRPHIIHPYPDQRFRARLKARTV